jgi:hypothetical protein
MQMFPNERQRHARSSLIALGPASLGHRRVLRFGRSKSMRDMPVVESLPLRNHEQREKSLTVLRETPINRFAPHLVAPGSC